MSNDELADVIAEWEDAFLQQRIWLYHWLFLPEISALAFPGLLSLYAQSVA